MMSRHLSNDLKVLVRGVQLVSREAYKLQDKDCREVWENSSVKSLLSERVKGAANKSTTSVINPQKDIQNNIMKISSEILERSKMVAEGLKAMSFTGTLHADSFIDSSPEVNTHTASLSSDKEFVAPMKSNDTESVKNDSTVIANAAKSDIVEKSKNSFRVAQNVDTEILEPLMTEKPITIPVINVSSETQSPGVTVKPRPKVKQSLSATAKQRAVPATRLSRLISFGSLAAGLGVGTVAEASRRALGITKSSKEGNLFDSSAFLSEANAERIVNTLCKVRGAALKIGQILSIQDNTIISPQLQKAFERVRQSADFMPEWQVEKVMSSELGSDWRSKMSSFETKPFAAASIGQVHLATLHDGTPVAMKIQYPGVAQGIESDIDNLVSVMKVWNIFPEGLFIDSLVEVAKRELAWEVDYEREAECTKKFKKLVEPYPEYVVPAVIDELSTKQIFSSELIEGMPVDQCISLDQETREHICRLVMNLCLKELFEFRYMQTDPNWSNFFYDPESRRLALLDFGATREYEKSFMDLYIQVIKCAADGDRDGVLKLSRALGFLTGYETKIMEQAHVDTVMILGEVFRKDQPFDFGRQDTTRRVQTLVPTMIYHRLCPPPEQIYSLHRKLSGVFLLCAKLRVAISCRPFLEQVWANYRFGEEHPATPTAHS